MASHRSLPFYFSGKGVPMFDDILDRMTELSAQLRGRQYEGHHEAVREVIRNAELALTDADSKIGPWERSELYEAMRAMDINFLNLALTCVGKAIEVNHLPPDHYEYGFSYTKKKG